jgi:hypothetical protein
LDGVLILAIGVRRVALGGNWPTDLLGGFAGGLLILWAAISCGSQSALTFRSPSGECLGPNLSSGRAASPSSHCSPRDTRSQDPLVSRPPPITGMPDHARPKPTTAPQNGCLATCVRGRAGSPNDLLYLPEESGLGPILVSSAVTPGKFPPPPLSQREVGGICGVRTFSSPLHVVLILRMYLPGQRVTEPGLGRISDPNNPLQEEEP